MRKFWTIAVIVGLLFYMTEITPSAQQNWEDELGMDMCPECRPLPPPREPANLHKENIGAAVRHGKDQLLSVGENLNLHLEDLGVDMCPEKGQPMSTGASQNLHEEDLGVDMCPEKGQPMSAGEKQDLRVEDYGVDMCPEKGQPMFVGGNHNPRILGIDSDNLVREMQQLLKAQQLQIDQLGGLLQQLGKVRSEVDSLEEEQTSGNKDFDVRGRGDKSLKHDQVEKTPYLDWKRRRDQQSSSGRTIDEKIASMNSGQGVIPADMEWRRSGAWGRTIAEYRPSFSENFGFLSAIKINGEISCLHVLPQVNNDEVNRYVVGDKNGQLYLFLWLGDLLIHHITISTSPITAMLSYHLPKNGTILVTGHADGGVLVHHIPGTEQQTGSKDGRSTKRCHIRNLHSLNPPAPHSLRASVEEGTHGETKVSEHDRDEEQQREASVAIVNLEIFKVGKMRYTIVVDESGKIQLFRDNGSLHGVAQSPSQPLAIMRNPNAQRLVFLTEKGVGTLDLRSMQVRSSFCVGLNTSTTVMAYAFDAVWRSKANGVTTDGDLVSVVLTGDMAHFECHVKQKRHLDISGPFSALTLKGYLVAATPDQVLVFNTTSQTGSYANFWVTGPRLLFSVPINEVARFCLKVPIAGNLLPMMASDRARFLVLGFDGGYVGAFHSNLPIKPADFNVKFWNTSILISVLVLLAIWQLFNRKKGPAPLVSSEHPLLVSSDSSESDRGSFGERDRVVERRRFKSPTRGYVAGNSTPFGSSSRSLRSSSVDTGTYPGRREPLFASNLPVGESELQ